MKTCLKILAGILGFALMVVVTLFVSMSKVNSPGYAWRVLTLVSSDTQDYKVFPSRPIENAAAFSPIEKGDLPIPSEVEYRYKDGVRVEILADLLHRTDTRAFLVLKDDPLIYKTY